MLPLLIILLASVPVPITVEPHDNSTLCAEVLDELNHSVALGIISTDAADGIYYRCLNQYSQGNP